MRAAETKYVTVLLAGMMMAMVWLPGSKARGQDYISYQHKFYAIDDDLQASQPDAALLRLDTILHDYSFISAHHCLKGVQVCAQANDSLRAATWLGKAIRQGVPLWVLRSNTLTAKALKYKTALPVLARYDSIRNAYEASVNRDVRDKIDRLLARDQRKTRRVNNGFVLFRHTIYGLDWLHNNNRQFKQICRLTDRYGFPGEKLIGISGYYDDSTGAAGRMQYWRRTLAEERAYVMLVHYYSYHSRHWQATKKWQQAVQNGGMPPWQYGTLNDYCMAYGGRIGRAHHHNYYVWAAHHAGDEAPDSVNARRYVMGLNTYEKQVQTALLDASGGKAKTATIILEQ